MNNSQAVRILTAERDYHAKMEANYALSVNGADSDEIRSLALTMWRRHHEAAAAMTLAIAALSPKEAVAVSVVVGSGFAERWNLCVLSPLS